jgi:hypothetical protein
MAAELAARALAEVCPGDTVPLATSSTTGSVDEGSAVGPSPAPSSSEEDSGCLDVPELVRAWTARGIGHALGPLRGPVVVTADNLGPIVAAPKLARSAIAPCTSLPGVRAPASAVRPCPVHVIRDPASAVRPCPGGIVCSLVHRLCSLDDYLWMDYVTVSVRPPRAPMAPPGASLGSPWPWLPGLSLRLLWLLALRRLVSGPQLRLCGPAQCMASGTVCVPLFVRLFVARLRSMTFCGWTMCQSPPRPPRAPLAPSGAILAGPWSLLPSRGPRPPWLILPFVAGCLPKPLPTS